MFGVVNDEIATAEDLLCDWDEDVWDKEATAGVFVIGVGDWATVNVDSGEASINPNAKEPETRIDLVVEEHEASADSDMEDNDDIRGVFQVASFSISSSITISLLIIAS